MVDNSRIELTKDTKVVAVKLGYYDSLREIGEVFYAKKGTIINSESWLRVLEEEDGNLEIKNLSVAELHVALADMGFIPDGVTRKKSELIQLLTQLRENKISSDS